MQKTRDHPNSRSGYVKEDVLKAISGFFIILAFIAVISLFAGMGGSSGGSSGGTSNSGSSDSKVIFVVNDMLLEAPKDTTWEEFVSNESLNTPGFTIVDDNVYLGDSKVIDSETNLPVTPDMTINSNIEYKDENYTDTNNGGENDSTTISTEYLATVDVGWSSTEQFGYFDFDGYIDVYGESIPLSSDNSYNACLAVGFDHEMKPAQNTLAFYSADTKNWISVTYDVRFTLHFNSVNDPYGSLLVQWLCDNNVTVTKEDKIIRSFTYAQSQAWTSIPIVRIYEQGMSWATFLTSDYNDEQIDGNGPKFVTGKFINENGYVKFIGTDGNDAFTLNVLRSDGSEVSAYEEIVEGYYISIFTGGGGGGN